MDEGGGKNGGDEDQDEEWWQTTQSSNLMCGEGGCMVRQAVQVETTSGDHRPQKGNELFSERSTMNQGKMVHRE